jgi:hypothetical protein
VASAHFRLKSSPYSIEQQKDKKKKNKEGYRSVWEWENGVCQ